VIQTDLNVDDLIIAMGRKLDVVKGDPVQLKAFIDEQKASLEVTTDPRERMATTVAIQKAMEYLAKPQPTLNLDQDPPVVLTPDPTTPNTLPGSTIRFKTSLMLRKLEQAKNDPAKLDALIAKIESRGIYPNSVLDQAKELRSKLGSTPPWSPIGGNAIDMGAVGENVDDMGAVGEYVDDDGGDETAIYGGQNLLSYPEIQDRENLTRFRDNIVDFMSRPNLYNRLTPTAKGALDLQLRQVTGDLYDDDTTEASQKEIDDLVAALYPNDPHSKSKTPLINLAVSMGLPISAASMRSGTYNKRSLAARIIKELKLRKMSKDEEAVM